MPWAKPRDITNIDDCYFYHTMDLPGHGLVEGEWDLRGKESTYLGKIDVEGKRVLEIGTASGHLCFWMEKMGTEVVAYDLSEEQEWDIVPYSGLNLGQYTADRKNHIRKLNNGFWFAHKAFNSKAKVRYGTAYEIPNDIGQFDVCTFGAILLHARDPFLALQKATGLVKETVVVTDLLPPLSSRMLSILNPFASSRHARFLPNSSKREPYDSWWNLSPKLVAEFLQILGFPNIHTTYHRQKHLHKQVKLYTVVAQKGNIRE